MAKYKDIADDIRRKILNEDYKSGQKLPYEYILCMSYQCNKETMKKALDILVKEGLIFRRRGAGTFVKEYDPSISEAKAKLTRGFSARYKDKKEVETEIVEFSVIPADEYLAKKMQIEEGDFVYHIIRLRKLDKQPFVLSITYMPINLIPGLKVEHIQTSVYNYIENNLKLKIQSAHLTITSALSTPLEQQYLHLSEAEPFIQEEQISYLTNGAIFEYTLSRQHYNNYEFQTILIHQ